MELLSLKEPYFVYLLQMFNCCFDDTPMRDISQTYSNEILMAVKMQFFKVIWSFIITLTGEDRSCPNSVATITETK